jgi:hypothetical protein
VTYSPRPFIVGPDDTLYRLASAKFSRMVDDPESHRVQRVRMVEAVVDVREPTPCAVVRLVYELPAFDAQRRLDRDAFMRRNVALAGIVVDGAMGGSVRKGTPVVDASSRFVAQGGRWQPPPSLEQRILYAALGELKCNRL